MRVRFARTDRHAGPLAVMAWRNAFFALRHVRFVGRLLRRNGGQRQDDDGQTLHTDTRPEALQVTFRDTESVKPAMATRPRESQNPEMLENVELFHRVCSFVIFRAACNRFRFGTSGPLAMCFLSHMHTAVEGNDRANPGPAPWFPRSAQPIEQRTSRAAGD